jgi:hypothetical protein
MADIVQSLFGITPESYQQAQAAQADRMALEYAQLKPLQQAQFAIGRGAYQLAGALGGEDPQLRMVSTRNAIAQRIDYTNPESMAAGIQALAQAGDTVGAMQLSDVLRKMQSEMALRGQRQAAAGASQAQAAASLAQIGRERAQAIPGDIAKSREVARLMEERDRLSQIFDETGQTARQIQYIDAQISELRRAEKPESMTEAMRNASALALEAGPEGSPEYNKKYREELRRLTTKETPDRRPSVGTDREAVALDMFDKNYYDLTPTERAAVNTRVEEKEGKKAAASAPKIIMPGQPVGAKDWMQFEKFIGDNPELKRTNELISVAPNALETIKRITTNDIAAKALPATLARLVGETGPLSNRDVARYARTGGLDDRLAQAASEFISGRGTRQQKDQALQFMSAVLRGALLEKKQLYVDQAERLGYNQSPEYKRTIEQIDRELAKFREVKPEAPSSAVTVTPSAPAARQRTGDPLVDKYLP